MHAGFNIQPPTCRPTVGRIGVTNARGRDVTDGWIGKWCQSILQIGRRWHVIGIELRDEVITIITDTIVEVGEVAFLTDFSAWPNVPVVVRDALAANQPDTMCLAPRGRFRVRILIRQPRVMRTAGLLECAAE